MTKEDIAKHFGLCNCDKIYTGRGLTAPDCPWHAFAVEEAMDEYARQEAVAFRTWCDSGHEYEINHYEERTHSNKELYEIYQQQKQK